MLLKRQILIFGTILREALKVPHLAIGADHASGYQNLAMEVLGE